MHRLSVESVELRLAQLPAAHEGRAGRDGVRVAQLEQHAVPPVEDEAADGEGGVVAARLCG